LVGTSPHHDRDETRARQPTAFEQGENRPALMCSTTGRKTRNNPASELAGQIAVSVRLLVATGGCLQERILESDHYCA